MNEAHAVPVRAQWFNAVIEGLRESRTDDRLVFLEFLSLQSTVYKDEAAQLFPLVHGLVLDPDTRVRYFARKARSRIAEQHPSVVPQPEAFPLDASAPIAGDTISTSEILLRKLKLGSRYVAFEAIERLTESHDKSLAAPLIDYLKTEKDPYKISFLVKRLSRIDDPAIPAAIAEFIDHVDPRVVANALEGLAEVSVPEQQSVFRRLSSSSDNRIRGNALKALARYDLEDVQNNIEQMLSTDNIALQDTAVYLLHAIRPPKLCELAEIALKSKYATVRLHALDLPRGSVQETSPQDSSTRDDSSAISRSDHLLFAIILFVGAVLSLPIIPGAQLVLAGVFAVTLVFQVIFYKKTGPAMNRVVISAGILAFMPWAEARFIALMGLLAIWLPFFRASKGYAERLAMTFCWAFVFLSALISRLIQGSIRNLVAVAGVAVREGSSDAGMRMLVSRQANFDLMLFATCAAAIFVMLRLEKFVPATEENGKAAIQRKLLIAFAVSIILIAALNFGHMLGTNVVLATNGSSAEMIINRLK